MSPCLPSSCEQPLQQPAQSLPREENRTGTPHLPPSRQIQRRTRVPFVFPPCADYPNAVCFHSWPSWAGYPNRGAFKNAQMF